MKQNIAIRYVVIGSAVALFLGLTVWLIRNEGRRTRESIREAAKEAGSEVRKGLVEGAERVVDKAAEGPGRIVRDVTKEVIGEGGSAAKQVVGEAGRLSREVLGEVKDILRSPEKPDAKAPAPAAAEKPPAPAPPAAEMQKKPPVAVQGGEPETPSQPVSPASGPMREEQLPPGKEQEKPPKPAQSRPKPKPLGESASGSAPGGPRATEPAPAPPNDDSRTPSKPRPGRGPARPDDPIALLFDLGHKVSRAVDEVGQEVLALSWAEEQDVGREVRRMIARDHKLLRPPSVIVRLERLARPIVAQRTRKELAFTLDVIQSDEVNAFAHAGGYLYVNTGMLKFATADAELQFFVAHEIAHQELKHVVKRMTYAARASQLGGAAAATLAQVAYLTIAMGYSKEQELEADAWAFRALLRAGRGRNEALSGMRQILEYVNQKNLEPKRTKAQDPAARTLQQIENHFRSHPPTEERLRQLEAILVP